MDILDYVPVPLNVGDLLAALFVVFAIAYAWWRGWYNDGR